MTDQELNAAIFAIETGHHVYNGVGVPDYCHDRAWCSEQQERRRLEPMWSVQSGTWEVYRWDDNGKLGSAPSLCRAICLAVLEIHRRKQ